MQYFIGFIIALFIALTGVGAGTVTVPVLVLFLGVPAPVAVGIGLMFSAAIKLILVPAQIARRNVAWRTLGFMLLGGAPGVLLGSLFLRHLVTAGSQNLLNAILGAILVSTASWQIAYSFRPMKDESRVARPQSAAFMADVSGWRGGGLFVCGSGRAGQRGSAEPDAVGAGADCGHGHRFRICGFAHRQRRALVFARDQSGAADAADCRRRLRSHYRNAVEHAHSAQAVAVCALGLAADSWRAVYFQQLSRVGGDALKRESSNLL